jgi:hypothetical protein
MRAYEMPKMASKYVQYKDHFVSPGCKSLLFLNGATGFNVTMDTDLLEPTHTWPAPIYPDSISDKSAVLSAPIFRTGRPADVLYQDGKSTRICEANCGLARFIANDLIAFYNRNSLDIRDTDGRVVFSETFHRRYLIASITPAPSGNSFAVLTYQDKGGNAVLDISPNSIASDLIIYRVGNGHPKTVLDLRSLKLKTGSITGIAVAPDGSRIAILCGPTLRVFDFRF